MQRSIMGVTGRNRRTLSRWASAAAAALLLATGCASAPPTPPPPDPGEETIAALTRALSLDAEQQKRTRELLKEMSDRDEAIRAGWSNGKKIRAEDILASHGRFEQEFFQLLTSEQRRLFIENRARAKAKIH